MSNLIAQLGLPQPKYTTGPQGNMIHDYSTERSEIDSPIKASPVDKRDNRDPEDVWHALVVFRQIKQRAGVTSQGQLF